ncbi:hypothetical protein LAV_00062 [Sphingobium phage Lacusarx]|uniref:Uncharacterized protein n=1 Tax=Sphingobium phage Lacusarx TaxID=1980139 RepID=A0A1W6DXG8_9CAUD|nr:hypothetical protein FDH44_gp062 [Sphingobium phage Lacusarx]ARK07462.1 hypothetical protein LAV_00062 [Sphingobium phage Lacusarx]
MGAGMPKSVCDHNKGIADCILRTFVGERLGKGSYRKVYLLRHDENRVVKVEDRGAEFCNITEFKVWSEVKDTPIEHWFAPCHYIDAMGICLIQDRTKPFETDKEFKAEVEKIGGKLPAFFDDIHFGNFGMLNGRLVCHDYGFNHFLKEAVKLSWTSLVNPNVEQAHHDTQLEMNL